MPHFGVCSRCSGAARRGAGAPRRQSHASSSQASKARRPSKHPTPQRKRGRQRPAAETKPRASRAGPAKSCHGNSRKAAATAAAPPRRRPAKPSGRDDASPRSRRRARGDPERPAWGGDFTGRSTANSASGCGRREGLPDAPQDPDHRRAERRGARGAAPRPSSREAGGRLAAGRGPGHRRARRPARQVRDQTADAANGTRWCVGAARCRSRPSAINDRRDARAVFEREEEAPRRRVESNSLSRQLSSSPGMQGLKKIPRARLSARTARCAASPSSTTRRWKASSMPLVGADGERVRAVPRRSGGRLATRAARSNTAPAFSCRATAMSSPTATSAHGRLPRHRAAGLGNAERVAEDAGGELALLRVYGARNAPAGLSLRANRQAASSHWSASPIRRRRAGARDLTARLPRRGWRTARGCSNAQPAPTAGFAGAAALDAQGRFGHGGDAAAVRQWRATGAGQARRAGDDPRLSRRASCRRPSATGDAKARWCG